MSAISLVCFNDKLEFIVVVVEKREICQQRYNFELSDEINTSTFLRTLVMVSRVGYTSMEAQGLEDGLHELIMYAFWRISLSLIGILIEYFWRIMTTAMAPGAALIKCKQAKQRLGIKWEANPPESPDLNPIEPICRMAKQRLKNRGPEEWYKITWMGSVRPWL